MFAALSVAVLWLTALTHPLEAATRHADQQLAISLGNRDVLFLVDSTVSMKKYFKIITNSVSAFISSQADADRNRSRYALAIYRDYNSVSGAFEVLSDFQHSNVIMKLDPKLAENYTGNTELPEAMFNGVIEAINNVTWRKNSTRTIIVIGDHGNHESDPMGRTIQGVVTVLEKHSIFFYAINVQTIERRFWEYNLLFRDQAQSILNHRNGLGNVIFSQPANKQMAETNAQENIKKVLIEISKISKYAELAARDILTGNSSFEQAEAKYGTIITSYLKEVISKENYVHNGLRNTSEQKHIDYRNAHIQAVDKSTRLERGDKEVNIFDKTGVAAAARKAHMEAEELAIKQKGEGFRRRELIRKRKEADAHEREMAPIRRKNRRSFAVIIGNKNYSGRIPSVDFAHNDADAMRKFIINKLGYREGNIYDLRDAGVNAISALLGNEKSHEGELFNVIRKGQSDVIVYYSGHGVPGLKDERPYLLPVDGDPNSAEITGFSVDTMYANLAKLPARSVTVFLDACFSGESEKGMLVSSASGISVKPKLPSSKGRMTVITAAQGNQLASWDPKARHGLFTKHLLDALNGEADSKGYGNDDGKVSLSEIKNYLDDEMTYQARATWKRRQNAYVRGSGDTILSTVFRVP